MDMDSGIDFPQYTYPAQTTVRENIDAQMGDLPNILHLGAELVFAVHLQFL